jgi:DnaK suppressor protein
MREDALSGTIVSSRRRSVMRKQDLARFRKDLEAQLASLTEQGAITVHEMGDSDEELPDPNDRATRESDRAKELRLRDRDRKLMEKIQLALRRIDEGTFGICDSCGQRIDLARLRARPVTTLCIECKREAELRERA